MPLQVLRQHLVRGEYLQARREAERLIRLQEVAGSDLVQAYRGAALAHYYLQDLFAAVKLGEQAIGLALSLPHWELQGKTRCELGTYYLHLGDVGQAGEHLQTFLDNMARYPHLRDLEAKAHHHMAFVYRHQRNYASALASHHMAASLFQRNGSPREMMEAVRGVVWCHLTCERPEQAWPFIERVSQYLQHHPDDALSASLLTDLAYYHRLCGDLKTSMDFCEEALIPGRPGVDDHVLATACVITGENAFDLNRLQEARIFANLALDYALKAKHPFLLNRVSALRKRLCEVDSCHLPD